MSTTETVHACPRCDLRFSQPVELLDHLRRDHPAPAEELPMPHGRVVLAVDPARPDPEAAIDVASKLATQVGAALEIVAARAAGLDDATTTAYLEQRARECRTGGAPWVSWHDLGSRSPEHAVVEHAADTAATWICLASRSRTAVGDAVFGSVASGILGTSAVPVVVVGPHVDRASGPFTRVVACVDRSPTAGRVVAAAAELADRLGARLVLLEVSIPTVNGDALFDDRHLRTVSRHLEREVDRVVLPGHRTWVPILDFLDGDPTTVVVTGRRPSTAAGRFVAGSVAANLARKARGPVMVVPEPADA
jgi:nucleotide-binding universal stress UspA family protein